MTRRRRGPLRSVGRRSLNSTRSRFHRLQPALCLRQGSPGANSPGRWDLIASVAINRGVLPLRYARPANDDTFRTRFTNDPLGCIYTSWTDGMFCVVAWACDAGWLRGASSVKGRHRQSPAFGIAHATPRGAVRTGRGQDLPAPAGRTGSPHTIILHNAHPFEWCGFTARYLAERRRIKRPHRWQRDLVRGTHRTLVGLLGRDGAPEDVDRVLRGSWRQWTMASAMD